MRCQQCERPAIYRMGDNGPWLCLHCADTMQSIWDRQFMQNAAMLNLAQDEMDAVLGIPSGGGRVPITPLARALQGQRKLNNIHITNSTVGLLNTGDLARIDAAITATMGSDAELIGAQITALTQAIIDTHDLAQTQKEELLDLVESLAEQIVGQRKPTVIRTLLKSIEDRAQGVAALLAIVQTLETWFS
jgi:hypothetical protein